GRVTNALRRANKPAWAAGLALIGTYALARVLEENTAKGPPAEKPAAKQHATKQPAIRAHPAAPVSARLSGWPRWKLILLRTYDDIGQTRLLALAAGVVFYGLLALFPAITALVSCYALFADPKTVGIHLAELSLLMPQA